MKRLCTLLALLAVLISGPSSAQLPGMTPIFLVGSGAAFTVKNSIVMVAASNQRLERTAGTPTNANKFTVAFWIKHASVGADSPMFLRAGGGGWLNSGGASGGGSVNTVNTNDGSGGWLVNSTNTTADTTTWHHIVYAFDSSQATAANRLHEYLDGAEVTYSSTTYGGQNSDPKIITASAASAIGGTNGSSSFPYDGKMAEFFLIDGQQLTPSSFVTGSGSGTTHPIQYSGTYGNQGYYLNFQNSGALGTDSSGNANNWTPVNTPTQSSDVPS
jgi:concanavalin A-like lectin/glucanase superfamily protein